MTDEVKEPTPDEDVAAISEASRRKKGTDSSELEGRVARQPGGAEFIDRVRRIGH